jgi:predicted Zn-dependent protease
MKLPLAAALSILTALTALAQAPSSKGVNFYSIEKEIELGQQIAASLEKSLPILHEPKLDAYIARLGASLAAHADKRFAYRFQLYDDRNPPSAPPSPAMMFPVDAFKGKPAEPIAIAGGSVFVPASLLAEADSEAEFAAQLAHAMAHIALRHASRLATRRQLVDSYTPGGNPGPVAPELGLMALARRFELEADQVAVATIAEAGYDPTAIVRYLERHRQSDSARKSQIFSAHPLVTKRLETVNAAIGELPARTYPAASGEFDAAKALVANTH